MMSKLAKVEPAGIQREALKPAALSLSISGAIQINDLESVFKLARSLANAKGFVPRHLLGDENGIAAAILTGIELGIGPMESMRVLNMIDGKPCMDASFMLARALRAGIRIEWEQHDDRAAVLRLERAGMRHTHAFTIEEAQRAGLVGKDNWKKYPPAMLRARCIAAAMRAFCPDVLGAGVYLTEELEATRAMEDVPMVETWSRSEADREEPTAIAELAPPLRLSDVRDESELSAWCSMNRETLSKLKNGRRKESQSKIIEAAGRCGVDEREALLWAGLSDE